MAGTGAEFVYTGKRLSIDEDGVIETNHRFVKLTDSFSQDELSPVVVLIPTSDLPAKWGGYRIGDVFDMESTDGGETFEDKTLTRLSVGYLERVSDKQKGQKYLAEWTLIHEASRNPRDYYSGDFLNLLEESFARVPKSLRPHALGWLVTRLSDRM